MRQITAPLKNLLTALAFTLFLQPAGTGKAQAPGLEMPITKPADYLFILKGTETSFEQISLAPSIYDGGYIPPGIKQYVEENSAIVSRARAKLEAGLLPAHKSWTRFAKSLSENAAFAIALQQVAVYEMQKNLNLPETIRIIGPDGSWNTVNIDSGPSPTPPTINIPSLSPTGQYEIHKVLLNEQNSAEYLNKAVNMRFPELRFMHRLGEVTIETVSRDKRRREIIDEINRVENAISSTRRYLEKLESEIEMEEAKLEAEAESEANRLKPFAEQLEKAAGGIESEKTAQPDKPVSEHAAAIKRKRLERRIGQIDRALKYLTDEIKSRPSEVARKRVAALTKEREDIIADLDTRKDPAFRQRHGARSEALTRYEDALALYRSEAHISKKRLDSLSIASQVKAEAKLRLLDEIAENMQKLQALQVKLDQFGQENVPPFSTIESADAEFTFDDKADSKIARLNELIAEQISNILESERMHAKAAEDLRQAADMVFVAALEHRDSTIKSYAYQAIAQWAVQALDIIQQAEGKPGPIIAMSVSQMVVNLLNPPRFYDADIDRKTGELFIANMPPDSVSVEQDARNTAATTAIRPLSEHAAMELMNKALRSATFSPSISKFVTVSTARAGLKKAIAGTPKSAKGGAIVRAVLIDALTEQGKARLAAVIQEDDLRAYLSAQEALKYAVERQVLWAEMRDKDKKALEVYRAEKARLKSGSPYGQTQTAGMEIKRNELFEVEEGYAITLSLEEGNTSILKGIEFKLAGISLKRGTSPGRFLIDADIAERIEQSESPEELPVTIVLK